jgi:hypothetical protein
LSECLIPFGGPWGGVGIFIPLEKYKLVQFFWSLLKDML